MASDGASKRKTRAHTAVEMEPFAAGLGLYVVVLDTARAAAAAPTAADIADLLASLRACDASIDGVYVCNPLRRPYPAQLAPPPGDAAEEERPLLYEVHATFAAAVRAHLARKAAAAQSGVAQDTRLLLAPPQLRLDPADARALRAAAHASAAPQQCFAQCVVRADHIDPPLVRAVRALLAHYELVYCAQRPPSSACPLPGALPLVRLEDACEDEADAEEEEAAAAGAAGAPGAPHPAWAKLRGAARILCCCCTGWWCFRCRAPPRRARAAATVTAAAAREVRAPEQMAGAMRVLWDSRVVLPPALDRWDWLRADARRRASWELLLWLALLGLVWQAALGAASWWPVALLYVLGVAVLTRWFGMAAGGPPPERDRTVLAAALLHPLLLPAALLFLAAADAVRWVLPRK